MRELSNKKGGLLESYVVTAPVFLYHTNVADAVICIYNELIECVSSIRNNMKDTE